MRKFIILVLGIAAVAFLVLQGRNLWESDAGSSGIRTMEKQAEESDTIPAPCDGFDFPVGPPNAKGYYNAQKFRANNHLGEDWNGTGGGNSDLGDPVYAIADGIVTGGKDHEGGWGNVARIVHNVGTKEKPELLESLYGHLDTMMVAKGDTVKRGMQIGTIGNAHGVYWAHLHLELRKKPGLPLGGGYDEEADDFLHPTDYIKAHRPKK